MYLSNLSLSPIHEIFFERSVANRQNSNLSSGSLTVGDYQDQVAHSSTSYLVDLNYTLQEEGKSSKYRALQELIISWMNDPSDYDIKEWPNVEKELKENKLKFRNDI